MGKRLNWELANKRRLPSGQLGIEKHFRSGDAAARWLERHDPMLDRQANKIIIECDSCDEVYSGRDGEDWTSTWAAAKQEGWRTKKIADVWVHGCPQCGV